MSVPELRRSASRPQAESPRARALPRHRPDRRRRALARRHRRRRARRARTGARSSSTTRRRCAPARAPTARPRRDALVVYGTKAFPNVALLRILAEEGIGADVSTLGELRFAQAAGIAGERPRRARQQQVRRGARARPPRPARSSSSTRSRRSTARARPASRARSIRVTPGHRGRHARDDPHRPPRLEVRPDARRRARGAAPRARDRGPPRPHRLAAPRRSAPRAMTVDWIAAFAARARDELGWELRTLDLGGGLGVAADARRAASSPIGEFVGGLLAELERACAQHGLAAPARDPRAGPLARRPRRRHALHGRLGQARRPTRRPTSRSTAACPTTPAPRSTAPATRRCSPNRADEPPAGTYTVVGKHCESGDLLIERVELPEPRRGDILAVPATGAYTLAMSSTYNAVPRPAAVLVARRRGARDPPPRDDRRPARARGAARAQA